MTKYSVSVFHEGEWNGLALFSDSVNFHPIVAFCYEQFECGNSLTTPGENIAITDLDTGEILWDWKSAQSGAYDEEWLDKDNTLEENYGVLDDYALDCLNHMDDADNDYWDDGCPIDDADESN